MSQKDNIAADTASQLAPPTHTILLDTDIGDDIDDALALALALNSPEIDLLGVTTTFGDTHTRAQLAKHILHIFGHDNVPVAIGVGEPLRYRHPASGVAQARILGDCLFEREAFSTFSGPELIVRTALAQHGALTLVCVGPLTNIALALLIDPAITSAIRNIVVMGGTSGIPFPEWNVRSDVEAARLVLSSGIPITLLGWNVTTRCQLRRRDLQRLRDAETAQTQLLHQLVTLWQQHRPRWHSSRPYLHDPLTIAALCSPDLLRWQTMPVQVVARGLFTGFMLPSLFGGPQVRAAVAVDATAAREWIVQRLLGPYRQA